MLWVTHILSFQNLCNSELKIAAQQARKAWLSKANLTLKGRKLDDQKSFLAELCSRGECHEIESAIALVASPSVRGVIKPQENKDNNKNEFAASFDTGIETVSRVFTTVPEACQWINKMEVAAESGKFRKGLENAGKAAPSASAAWLFAHFTDFRCLFAH